MSKTHRQAGRAMPKFGSRVSPDQAPRLLAQQRLLSTPARQIFIGPSRHRLERFVPKDRRWVPTTTTTMGVCP
uniref:Uncharacterized protein n=1 Tax=uncultured delta proteobacterium HF0010_01J10 TaxID=710820 RepID=E0XQD7_9DELT|nr:hypothetical protein [uncultured delta proteobacterium HF0010_01J10]